MLAKFARRFRRRSMHLDLESTQDTKSIQVVDELQLQREVVDTAPDLIRCCSLETPFPTVTFGGYIKYYRDRAETTEFTDPDTLFSLTVNPSPLPCNNTSTPPTISSFSQNSPECPTTMTVQETEPLKTPRRTSRPISFSGSFSISEKSPKLFRSKWKRATCIISSSIAEHDLSPLFSRSSSSDTNLCRPSFEMARSLSSKGSSDSSDTPDSITHQYRHTTPDSEFTLPPNTPTSTHNNDEADAIMVVEPHDDITICRTRRWSQRCRPVSSSSYGTAQSVFD